MPEKKKTPSPAEEPGAGMRFTCSNNTPILGACQVANAVRNFWKYETRNGKKTKVPYNPHTGERGKSNDRSTFSDYATVLSAVSKYHADGIGVGIFGRLAAVDLDHCFDEDGTPSDLYVDVAQLLDCYTEFSPSRRGAHFLFLVPDGYRYDRKEFYIKGPHAEVYVAGMTKRFMTYTGDEISDGRGLLERGQQLDVFLDRYMRQPHAEDPPEDPPPVSPSDLPDAEILERASNAKNGDRFTDLWNGNVASYSSLSEADLALCCILAFWTRDPLQIDRLFRQSGLMRDKWTREDYRTSTIEKALSRVTETYTPRKSGALDWNDTIWYDGPDPAPEPSTDETTETSGDAVGDAAPAPDATPEASPPAPGTATASITESSTKIKLTTYTAAELLAMDFREMSYLVDDMMPDSGFGVLAGPPKVGKSWMCLDLACCVASGRPFLTRRTSRSGVLYLCLEDSFRRVKNRLNRVLNGAAPPDGLHLAVDAPRGNLTALSEYLAAYPDTKLIIADTISKFREFDAGGKKGLNSYERDYLELAPLKQWADANGVFLLVVTHLRKQVDDGDVFNMISGSTGMFGVSDAAFVLHKDKRSDETATLEVTGRDISADEFALSFDKSSCTWHYAGRQEDVQRMLAAKRYNGNSIVRTVETLLKQSPDGTWSGKMSDLLSAGRYITGKELATDAKQLSTLVKNLEPPFLTFGGIVHEKGKNGSGGATHKFSYRNGGPPPLTELPENYDSDIIETIFGD